MFCQICKEEIPDSEFNKHPWRRHDIRLEEYFIKYHPRFDLHDQSIIQYKNPIQYLSTDFNSKNNFRMWLKNQTKEAARNYCKNLLIRRKSEKSLIYAPGQFELRSTIMPSILSYENMFGEGSYKKICEEIGLKLRYDYCQKIEIEEKELNFIVDTRENLVLNVPNKQIAKLDVGDYTIDGSELVIEKKSLVDFCGTLSKGFDRFCRELDRCVNNNQYLIILVEEKFNNINSIAYLPHTKRIKATNDFIFHQAREIINKYPLHCQIVCVDGKKEAVKFVKKIFLIKNDPKSIDFQYFIDTNKDFFN